MFQAGVSLVGQLAGNCFAVSLTTLDDSGILISFILLMFNIFLISDCYRFIYRTVMTDSQQYAISLPSLF